MQLADKIKTLFIKCFDADAVTLGYITHYTFVQIVHKSAGLDLDKVVFF